MTKFRVEIINTTVDIFEIEASDRENAIEIYDEKFALGDLELVETRFINWEYGDISEITGE